MKKLLIATLFSAFALTSQAQWYVQGDVGVSNVKFEAYDVNVIDDTSFSQRISGGYDFGQFRVAADYTNFGKVKRNASTIYGDTELSLKAKSFGISGFYDIETNSNLTPYVGVRLSSNKLELSGSAEEYETESYSDTVTGAGVLAGVNYKLNENLHLNAGIEYNRLSEETHQVGANVGLRYNF